MVQGGFEPACVGEAFLAAHQAQGHDCPRREWTDPLDVITADLAILMAKPESAHLGAELIAAHGLTREERLACFGRYTRAFRDEAIAAYLWPRG